MIDAPENLVESLVEYGKGTIIGASYGWSRCDIVHVGHASNALFLAVRGLRNHKAIWKAGIGGLRESYYESHRKRVRGLKRGCDWPWVAYSFRRRNEYPRSDVCAGELLFFKMPTVSIKGIEFRDLYTVAGYTIVKRTGGRNETPYIITIGIYDSSVTHPHCSSEHRSLCIGEHATLLREAQAANRYHMYPSILLTAASRFNPLDELRPLGGIPTCGLYQCGEWKGDWNEDDGTHCVTCDSWFCPDHTHEITECKHCGKEMCASHRCMRYNRDFCSSNCYRRNRSARIRQESLSESSRRLNLR